MLLNILDRNNGLLNEGKLDEQIISDLVNFIDDKKRYQSEHLDVRVKTDAPHHYDAWTAKTQMQIKYAERILECVRANTQNGGI